VARLEAAKNAKKKAAPTVDTDSLLADLAAGNVGVPTSTLAPTGGTADAAA